MVGRSPPPPPPPMAGTPMITSITDVPTILAHAITLDNNYVNNKINRVDNEAIKINTLHFITTKTTESINSDLSTHDCYLSFGKCY